MPLPFSLKSRPILPDNCETLAGLLSLRAGQDPEQTFALCKDESITLRELEQRSQGVARSLIEQGVRSGENVAIISHSSIDYLVYEFGILKAGAVCVPVNCLLKHNELSYVLENADIVLAIVHPNYLEEFQNSQSTNDRKIPHWVIEANTGREWAPITNPRSVEPQSISASYRNPTTGYEDPCLILYTSGTTGAPKGVVYENYAMVPRHDETYVQQMMDVIELGPDDTTYLPFALYHVLGQVHVVGALRNGGRIALAERFSASQFWNDVRKYGATVLVHQGASIPLLLKQPPNPDLDRKHRVRLTVGAGVPSEEVWRAFETRFGVKIYEHYAQTEGAFFGAGTMPTNRVGTIGLPYRSAELRLVDAGDEDLKRVGESGQLISRLKPQYAKKTPDRLYYRDAERGGNKLGAVRFTADGWFRSGDVARFDEEGYLHYVGKVETFIRYRGENISPLQIESVLSKHPSIEECIAVGVANAELGGDDIKVVIATRQGRSLSAPELIAWCEDALPRFMLPRYVEFVLELKKTEQTKKILRSEYRENSQATWDRLEKKK